MRPQGDLFKYTCVWLYYGLDITNLSIPIKQKNQSKMTAFPGGHYIKISLVLQEFLFYQISCKHEFSHFTVIFLCLHGWFKTQHRLNFTCIYKEKPGSPYQLCWHTLSFQLSYKSINSALSRILPPFSFSCFSNLAALYIWRDVVYRGWEGPNHNIPLAAPVVNTLWFCFIKAS